MSTKAVNLKSDPYDVYIGRKGKGLSGYFGNPYRAGDKCARCGEVHVKGAETLGCYEEYLIARLLTDAEFAGKVRELQGKKLGCFCKPARCHGDLLAKAADYLAKLEKL